MTEISFFQRYSGRENHATNNTLLMLRYVHQASPADFERLMRQILDDANIAVGPRFSQQVRLQASLPDGAVRQAHFALFIEAKAGVQFDDEQIIAHLDGIKEAGISGPQTFLLLLTPEAVASARVRHLAEEAAKRGGVFASATFAAIVAALREATGERGALAPVIADFEAFLDAEGLMPVADRIAVFAVGTSHAENLNHRLYYEPASRPSKAGCRYIGLYRRLEVTHVADMGEAYVAAPDGAGLDIRCERDGTSAIHEVRLRIEAAVSATTYYDLRAEAHRFYLVDAFHRTSLRKRSAPGVMGLRYLSAEKLGVHGAPPARRLAELLDGRQFD